jgi:hypothetical protein
MFANLSDALVPQGRLKIAQDEILGRESKTEQSRRDD